jgi:hypothetical protein
MELVIYPSIFLDRSASGFIESPNDVGPVHGPAPLYTVNPLKCIMVRTGAFLFCPSLNSKYSKNAEEN